MHPPTIVLRGLRRSALPMWALACAAALTACGGQPIVSPDHMAKSRITPEQLTQLDDAQLQARRDVLASERSAAGTRYTQAEAQCWKRFAVTPCIDQAARPRRATQDQLRADDIALQDEQRKRRLQRADERLQGKQEGAQQR